MWLVIDIGNSAVKAGFFDGSHLHDLFHLPPGNDPSSWRSLLRNKIQQQPVKRIGITSVVPVQTARLVDSLYEITKADVFFVHHELLLPFRIKYQTPDTLGTDRLAAAAAAWTRYRSAVRTAPPVVVVDAGTAVTYEVIDVQGDYLGGAIAAGPHLLRNALAQGTAQLPEVPLSLPGNAIGRSTQTALQAGIMMGFIDSVAGMLDRLSAALGEHPLVIATGGWATLLQNHLPAIEHVEPDLVLLGIAELMKLNY